MALGLAWLAATTAGLVAVSGLPGLDFLPAACLAGSGLGAIGAGRLLRGACVAGLLVLLGAGWTPGLDRLIAPLVREDSLPRDSVDAVVVLAGSVSTDGRLSPAAADRMLEGLRLVRTGVASRLVVSRVTTPFGPDTLSSDLDQHYLLETSGLVPDLSVLTDVGSTRIEATRAREQGGERWRRLVVVSSPLHTRRACAAFEKVGFQVICRPSPERSHAVRTLPRPTDRIGAFGEWLYETLAWLEYRARGWV